jgi:hypothetical protein
MYLLSIGLNPSERVQNKHLAFEIIAATKLSNNTFMIWSELPACQKSASMCKTAVQGLYQSYHDFIIKKSYYSNVMSISKLCQESSPPAAVGARKVG